MRRSLDFGFSVIAVALLLAGTAFAGTAQRVPEPVSLSLLGIGGAGLYLLHRRSRQ